MSSRQVSTSFRAWGDESGSVAGIDEGVYVMAAVLASPDQELALSAAMRELRLPGQKKVHWRGDSDRRHDQVIEVVASLPLEAVVVVRRGPKTDRDERRRRKCFERFAPEIDSLGCVNLTLESRGAAADKRDRNMLDALRARKVVTGLRLSHAAGPTDPVLWIADAVCGAVVAHRVGRPSWRERLESRITVYEIDQS